MTKLKFVRLPIFDAAAKVRVAGTTSPTDKRRLSRFHDSVTKDLAALGFQLLVDILRVTIVLPEFFTYIVFVTALPGLIFPQLIEVQPVIQPKSEYTPTFTALTLPDPRGIPSTPIVARVSSKTTIATVIIVSVATFRSAIMLFPLNIKYQILTLNKYSVSIEQHKYNGIQWAKIPRR